PFGGELRVLGLDPRTQRDELMRDVCFMADVAVLPRWLRVSQALAFCEGVHPRFDRSIVEAFLRKTDIHMASRVRQLSKGMVTQLHLALIMAIDARLLVLDEPTLGSICSTGASSTTRWCTTTSTRSAPSSSPP